MRALLRLREMILEGELSPAQRLSEPMLVERIGVSRTPIRVALVRLEHEGLIEAHDSGGYRIRLFSRADVFDAIELRGTIEGLLARYAAQAHPDHEALSRLTAPLAAIDAVLAADTLSDDAFAGYLAANGEFHDRLRELAGSRLLGEALERAVMLPFASPSAFVAAQAGIPESRRILDIAQYQHRCLAAAIAAADGARAEALAREHARLAKRNLEIVLAQDVHSKRVPGLRLIAGD